MASCGISECGRKDLDEPGPGLELHNGKYSCVLCYINVEKFGRSNIKKHKVREEQTPLAGPAEKTRDEGLFD